MAGAIQWSRRLFARCRQTYAKLKAQEPATLQQPAGIQVRHVEQHVPAALGLVAAFNHACLGCSTCHCWQPGEGGCRRKDGDSCNICD